MSNTNKIVERVRTLLKKISWRNILTFSFFVILAFIFWAMQVYREKYETEFSVPIKYVNVPDSIVFETDLPNNINVKLKDDGASIVRYLTRGKDSLRIDIRQNINTYHTQVIQGRDLETLIKTKLLVSSELLSYSPSQINFAHNVLHQKKLPIVYNGNLNIPAGYIIDGEFTLKPDSVFAYGSQAALDTIHHAHITPNTIYSVTETGNIDIDIWARKGIKFIPHKTLLHIPIAEFTVKQVEVPITCINLPKDLDIKFFPSSVKIPFYVSLKRFDSIKADDFRVIVDYLQTLSEDNRLSSTSIIITQSPNYIKLNTPIPSEVEFVLEQKPE